jgi:uncharacterized protein YcaQ
VVDSLSREQARRMAVRAQLLSSTRPDGLLPMVEQLTALQVDPNAAIAPSVDLVAWSRLGSAYRPAELRAALEADGTLFELGGMVRPMSDLRLYLAGMAAFPTRESTREWLAVNDPFRRDILVRLEDYGPLLSREIPDTCVVPWQSSGWTNNRNVTQMLEILALAGQVAIAGRRESQRLWDVAERVYPDTVAVPLDEAQRIRDERRLRALGIVREKAPNLPMEPGTVGAAGITVTVDGLAGLWRADPDALQSADAALDGRAALLSPYDRLAYDRARAADLFGFEYLLEVYKPKAKRRWGYYALPILFHDKLVGKLDATADRREGVLRVDAIHEDVPFTKTTTAAVRREIRDLAEWLDLGLTLP